MRNLQSIQRGLAPPDISPPIKVLLLITKGEIGGAQTHVETICLEMKLQVKFVIVIGGTEPETYLGSRLSALGVPVLRLNALDNSMSPLRIWMSVAQLLPILRQLQPAVIHAHSTAAGVVGRIAGALARVPVVYTVHGFGFKPEVTPLRRGFAWLAEFILARFTGHLVCVSESERQLALRLPLRKQRVSVIYNTLPDSIERSDPGRATVRIIMVARLANPKRPDLLLEALALLRDRLGCEVPTSIVGSGPHLATCTVLASRHNLQTVTFTGDVDDVPHRLADSSIFVLMSDHEGLPISVIEAMRAGLAIVASNLPGIRELITHEEHGCLVPNQAIALATAIEALVESPTLRTRLGRAARVRFEQRFRSENATPSLAAIYVKLGYANRTHPHDAAR